MLLTRPTASAAAAARITREIAIRAGRPAWQNSVGVPIPAPGRKRFPPGTLMKLPGGLTTDTPPPDMANLGAWVSSIVGQGIPQQERGGRVLIGWASVAANNGDGTAATAYRHGALKIATAYAPKKAAADKHYAERVAAGRAPAGQGGVFPALMAAMPQAYDVQATVKYQAQAQAQVSGYGQDAIATAQTVMADWEAMAAEDPASGPVHMAVTMAQSQLQV